MALAVNKTSRKRKPATELIFEVDEADFSPTNSPEPVQQNMSSTVNEFEFSLTSNDVNKTSEDNILRSEDNILRSEDNVLRSEDNILKSEDISIRTEISETSEATILKLDIPDTSKELNKETLNSTVGNIFKIKTENQLSGINTDTMEPQLLKSDVDLRCMDMEVVNSPPPPSQTLDKPFISLVFRDNDVAYRIRSKLIRYIKNVVEFEFKLKLASYPTDVAIDFWEDNVETIANDGASLNSNSVESLPTSENVDLFTVDITPSKKPESLPRYISNLCKVIGEPESKNIDNRRMLFCFNCDGNHSIKDCKEMKNIHRITQARNRFLKSQQKNVRYHVDDEYKYKHLEPGKISDELRRALDVRKHELPPYIYRMRSLGYPPGWLQEAMITNSNLELFDFQGCAINDGGGDNKKIDPNKVVEYPGFNVPFEKGYKDEFKYFNCPPYSENFSKKCMIEFIEKDSCQIKDKKENCNSVQKFEESDNNSQESKFTDKLRRSESPSLMDLEMRKKELLAELEEGNLNSPQPSICDPNELNKKSTNILPKNITVSPSVVSSLFGTPILQSTTSYIHLPDRDKFSKDISQVINFENLPDSTGKYEQMSEVINKVRNTIKNAKS